MQAVSKVVCPGCGCCCDDIELVIENNKIVRAKNACALGAAKFENYYLHRNTNAYIRRGGVLKRVTLNE
ncbi:formylmethanofuran dehydrogenase subunit B, partial [Candidatus Bathyarchaeota archaeon]|nr:formylmethanofuran dehydrogenase subunit B [Candidatus Bathyarchaeota archaeon]